MNEVVVPILTKEAEAIVWGLAQISDHPNRKAVPGNDPLFVLLSLNYSREAIMETCVEMFEVAYSGWLAEPMTALEKDILRVCVENSSWINSYIRSTAASNIHIEQARQTLRDLAEKLETFDITVNFIPYN